MFITLQHYWRFTTMYYCTSLHAPPAKQEPQISGYTYYITYKPDKVAL